MFSDNKLSPAEAQQLIERIARGYGWISRTAREATPQESLDAIGILQEGYGAAVRTLAKNLYRSQARFVFELIQNAEDNLYTKATSRGAKPYIKFAISPDKIIIDCNEDGFTSENVEAICKVGQSTKTQTGAQQYIGEKGIGFKSVFMVASKVHIQSGPFSFSFEHGPGERGMGMVTPIWESTNETLQEPLTRMTLTLLETLDYPDLLAQFDALPDTLLLFLDKLGAITLDMRDISGEETECTSYSCEVDTVSARATLCKVYQKQDLVPEMTSKHYHITRKSLSDLPRDEQRDYETAEVVLAFPIDSQSVPVIGRQDVYAYLPIRDFGFPFLIQSDFVTQASRQDVMETSRNKAVLDGIAKTFLDAVLQFCQHPTLQYQWMRYIPQNVSEPFWLQLVDSIKNLLKVTPILRGRSKGPLRPISQLKILRTGFSDRFGRPLVADLPKEMYLASKYTSSDRNLLKPLGLRYMNITDFIARLEQDLESLVSKFKSPETNKDWHERAATQLLKPFDTPDLEEELVNRIRRLPLVPLQNGEWSAVIDGPIFLPHTDGMLIPSDLGLRVVTADAVQEPTRKRLFHKLGVTSASSDEIRTLILAKYRNKSLQREISLEVSVKHLHYLYWTHTVTSFPGEPVKLRDWQNGRHLWIFDHRGELVDNEKDLYFRGVDEYSFESLFGVDFDPDDYMSIGSLINPVYLESVPVKNDSSLLTFPTWEQWLEECLDILRHPRLVSSHDPTTTSSLFDCLAEEQPEKVLGLLKAHWSVYECLMNPELATEISEVELPCTNIGVLSLEETFLPLQRLKSRCSEFLEVEKFPFLRLDGGDKLDEWRFLKVFHVGVEDNLDFYLKVLYFSEESGSPFRYGVYEAVQRAIWACDDADAQVLRVKQFIDTNKLVLVPAYDSLSAQWHTHSLCLWDAPRYLTTKRPLLPLFSSFNTPTLTAFFRETLSIPDLSWQDLISELRAIKERQQPNTQNILDIYHRLHQMTEGLDAKDLESLCTTFRVDPLIFTLPEQPWVTSSSCLWSEDAQIPGKSTIGSQYKDLKDFFVGVLKVKILDLGMLVEELYRAAKSSPSIDDVKNFIWQINSFSPSGTTLQRLDRSRILPVRRVDGKIVLRRKEKKFSIIDRQHLADAFDGLVDVLDFDLKESRALQPFLLCLDLRGRYLSNIVVEKSSFRGVGTEPSRIRTRHLRRRAHALSRCATHFSSPRARNDNQALYQLLLHAEVYETNEIVGTLEHTIEDTTVMVETNRYKLHIGEVSGRLRIYVPTDSREQQICYLRLLPTKLFNETIMENQESNSTLAVDSSAVAIITAIFASSDDIIDLVLEEAGIVPVPYPDQFQDEASSSAPEDISSGPQVGVEPDLDSETESTGSGTQLGTSTPDSSTPSARNARMPSPSVSTLRASYMPDSRTSSTRPPISLFSPFGPNVEPPALDIRLPFTPDSGNVEYRRLLDDVIRAARNKRGGFPSQGSFNLEELFNALPVEASRDGSTYDLPFGVRNENQLAHDMKVGAAGELYAFEILSRLETSLPGFGRQNWQSTIRRHVTAHEKYRDMEPWRGAETADVTYNDIEGEFTQLLISNGYLDGSIWADARPKYFLEVKTTTKECATRFFLSKSQYQRMQRMKLGVQATTEVYIILRVFNLDRDGIDMRLYLDPAGMEERDELQFTSESYSVLPLGRNSF